MVAQSAGASSLGAGSLDSWRGNASRRAFCRRARNRSSPRSPYRSARHRRGGIHDVHVVQRLVPVHAAICARPRGEERRRRRLLGGGGDHRPGRGAAALERRLGVFSDRYGRKLMLLRAMYLGSVASLPWPASRGTFPWRSFLRGLSSACAGSRESRIWPKLPIARDKSLG